MKRAHKLTEKVLHPPSIEKTNVKLADACFHESTIDALKYYAPRGYPEFSETAKVFKIIRNWFNSVNIKSPYDGQRTIDPHREKIDEKTIDCSLLYFEKFNAWVEKWKASEKPGLSRQNMSEQR